MERAFDLHLAVLSNSKIKADDATKLQKLCWESIEDLRGRLNPWNGATAEERSKKDTEAFKEHWKRFAGFDPDDKEALEKWNEEVRRTTSKIASDTEAAKNEDRKLGEDFNRKVEEVRLKRLRQRGLR